ncbi:LLM class flavin-dependent oxidoreductase [Paenibacillus sp.]|uniref:LLM class flavin-dependent oxidoreductase n=1 Tax=Paenibacillus sp. TaxID=58172 RepID=UPI002D2BF9F9|nr:LLM class flavin-dependent oxidoreductase [Paenibacillus sp.]HZG54881.1 LLM class flavin-dependent oxidoreductase [Paenibacillus sp.]
MAKLSVLDQSHIAEGRTASDALAETTRLAQAADRLGYERYWVSEHHGMRTLAHSSPEVLLAHLGAHTERIRLGSGGVMLPHYSSYKVAENFRLLEALHPGRIDVGLGRAPGGMPLASRALQEDKRVEIDRYPEQVEDLLGYLHDALPPDHRFARLLASPSLPTAPDVWLLGSSDESARIAARQGLAYGFAQFFGVAEGERAMRIYRESFRPSPYNDAPRSLIAVLAICGDTEEEANRLALSTDLFFLRLELGLELTELPSVATAEDYPYTEYDLQRIRFARQRRFVGTPDRVKADLLAAGERFGTDEFMIVSPIHDPAARIRSYELLADAFGLGGR